MALNDLGNQNIQDTYKKVVQTEGNLFADGSGSAITTFNVTSSHAISASYALSSSHEITYELSSSHAETADALTPGIDIDVRHITASGNISSSGTISAGFMTLSGNRLRLENDNFDIMDGGLEVNGNVTASGNISSSGTGTFNGVVIDDYITHAGDANSYFGFSEPDDWHLITNGKNVIRQHNNGTLFLYHSNAQILSTRTTGIDIIGSVKVSTHVTASSNISASGIINAQQLNLSNKHYGDFNGTLFRVGASAPSEYQNDLSVGNKVFFDASSGHITASGNISASGDIFGYNLYADNFLYVNGNIAHSDTQLRLSGERALVRLSTGHFGIGDSGAGITDHLLVPGHITASGNISGSKTGTVSAGSGSFHVLKGDTTKATGLSVAGYIEATNITASGDISSSGFVYAERIYSDGAYYSKGYGVLGTDGVTTTVAKTGLKTHIDGTNIYLDGPVTASGNIKQTGDNYVATNRLYVGNGNGNTAADLTSLTDAFVYKSSSIYIIGGASGDPIHLKSNVTASGNISSSGTITAEHIVSSDDIVASGELFTNGTSVNKIAGILTLGSSAVPGGGNTLLVTGTSTFTSHITSSGNISSSGTVTGVRLAQGSTLINDTFAPIAGGTGIETVGALNAGSITSGFTSIDVGSGAIKTTGILLGGNITGSNISASGHITATGTIAGSNLSGTNTGDETQSDINALAITTVGTVTSGNVSAILPSGTMSGSAQLPSGTISSSLQNLGNITGSNISASGNYIGNRQFDQSTSTDNNQTQGDIVYFGTHGSISEGDIVFLKANGSWEPANAGNVGTSTNMLGICLGAAITDGILIKGPYTLDHDLGNSQTGNPLYLSSTDGQAIATTPTSGFVRIIGYQLGDDDEIWFDPDKTWVEL